MLSIIIPEMFFLAREKNKMTKGKRWMFLELKQLKPIEAEGTHKLVDFLVITYLIESETYWIVLSHQRFGFSIKQIFVALN